jgi:hypothetical protein
LKTSQAITISLSALACGFVAGEEFANFNASQTAKIGLQTTIAEFTMGLKEDTTTLALVKRNRLDCAQSFMEKRVKSAVAVAGSYRDLADASGKGKLDGAVASAREQLRAPRLVLANDPKTCF